MRRLRNTVLPGLLIVALLAVAYVVHPRAQGIDVTVTLAERCPGRTAGALSCERPYPAFVRVVKPGRHEVVAGHRAPATGRFRFHLDPGRYLLLPAPLSGRPAARARSVQVFVRSDHYSLVRVRYAPVAKARARPRRGR